VNTLRTLTFRISVVTLLLAWGTTADAQTRFVNLSDRDVFLARYSYQGYQSSISAGEYNLPAEVPEGWDFSGWQKIEPGGTHETSPGAYYVEDRNGPRTWGGLDKSPGFVTNERFNVFVSKNGWSQRERDLLRKGFRKVQFQSFRDGTYTISGDAYVVREREFSFDTTSRSVDFIIKDFDVPGRVSDFKVNADSKWAKGISWRRGDRRVSLTGSVEGRQVRPFGPREPGYYRGRVTVYYTVRR